MSVETDVKNILDSVLSLQGRSADWQRPTPLLGAVPELDSMAVLGIITGLEERFGFVIHDDELDSAIFATLGSLSDFVAAKLAG
ncbi:acyl carrier protein [Rhodoferax sp. BLA1]|uniref:acyl carrier protein n=1 Tax=Rhodoferax sp. BLA1 TaxID=2576062 RepID=UPI0015D3FB72